MRYEELTIEGRNAVLEAFRSGKTIDKLFVLDGCQDGPVRTIVREAKKYDTIINYVAKEQFPGKRAVVVADETTWDVAGKKVEEELKKAGVVRVMSSALPSASVRRMAVKPSPLTVTVTPSTGLD